MPALIEDYALVGDMQSAALMSRAGSVDWLCLPRFDSPACFAALLGTEQHGRWRIAPVGAAEDGAAQPDGPVTRRYRPDTLILETEWHTPAGRSGSPTSCRPATARTPRWCASSRAWPARWIWTACSGARFGYGQVLPWMRRLDGCVVGVAGPDSVWLSTPVTLTGRAFQHQATFTVEAGTGPVRAHLEPVLRGHPRADDPHQAEAATERFWCDWVARCTYQGCYRDAVVRSLITLKALTYQPTGGIVAAATTSLPEDLGGIRNWDYRYCWLRDATITLEALLRTGYTDEAMAWREWLGRAVAGDPQDVQIMYGVRGERGWPSGKPTGCPGMRTQRRSGSATPR